MPTTTAAPLEITDAAQLERAVEKLGKLGRQIADTQTAMDAELVKKAKPFLRKLDRYKAQAKELDAACTAYAEAHRDDLLAGQDTKTVTLPTGKIQYKLGRPSVRLTMDEELICERLREMGFERAVNTKVTVDKRVILANPDITTRVPGIEIEEGAETISIKPHSL